MSLSVTNCGRSRSAAKYEGTCANLRWLAVHGVRQQSPTRDANIKYKRKRKSLRPKSVPPLLSPRQPKARMR